MTSRRAGLLSVVGVVAGAGLVLLLAMLAARSGPHRLYSGTLRDPNVGDPSFPPSSQTPTPFPHGHGGPGRVGGSDWLAILTAVIAFAAFALVAAVLVYLLRQAWDAYAGRDRRVRLTGEEFDVLDDPSPLAAEIRRDSAAQLAALRTGEARNAIVSCWERFESQAERVGLPRYEWEASSEFTQRLLELVSADRDGVRTLEALYREARFSDHEVGEPQREAAIAALQRIHLSLAPTVSS